MTINDNPNPSPAGPAPKFQTRPGNNWKFAIGDLVAHLAASQEHDTQRGIVECRSVTEDSGGAVVEYWVRWVASSGELESNLMKLPEWLLSYAGKVMA